MITTLNLVAGRWRSGNNPPRWASSAWIVEIMVIGDDGDGEDGMREYSSDQICWSKGANLQGLKGLEKQSAHLNRN